MKNVEFRMKYLAVQKGIVVLFFTLESSLSGFCDYRH